MRYAPFLGGWAFPVSVQGNLRRQTFNQNRTFGYHQQDFCSRFLFYVIIASALKDKRISEKQSWKQCIFSPRQLLFRVERGEILYGCWCIVYAEVKQKFLLDTGMFLIKKNLFGEISVSFKEPCSYLRRKHDHTKNIWYR